MNDLEKMRHTLSHVLAAAVQELYPGVKFGIGPAIDECFYYDIDLGDDAITEDDLVKDVCVFDYKTIIHREIGHKSDRNHIIEFFCHFCRDAACDIETLRLEGR